MVGLGLGQLVGLDTTCLVGLGFGQFLRFRHNMFGRLYNKLLNEGSQRFHHTNPYTNNTWHF